MLVIQHRGGYGTRFRVWVSRLGPLCVFREGQGAPGGGPGWGHGRVTGRPRSEGGCHKKGRRRSMSFAMLGSGRRHDGASLGIRTNQGGLVPGGGKHGGKVLGQVGFAAAAFLFRVARTTITPP